jgi:hypothetical protein
MREITLKPDGTQAIGIFSSNKLCENIKDVLG